MIRFQINLSLAGYRRFRDNVVGGSDVIHTTLKQIGVVYRSFIARRYDSYSKGAGDWPPLKTRQGSILRDTGTLFRVMTPIFQNQVGAIELIDDNQGTIDIGYGGPAIHPSSKGVTIADIAAFHNFGRGHNPKRQIIVLPDPQTKNTMTNMAERNLQRDAIENVMGRRT